MTSAGRGRYALVLAGEQILLSVGTGWTWSTFAHAFARGYTARTFRRRCDAARALRRYGFRSWTTEVAIVDATRPRATRDARAPTRAVTAAMSPLEARIAQYVNRWGWLQDRHAMRDELLELLLGARIGNSR